MKTANQTVDYSFDELNRLKTVTDASGTTTYTYDAVGNRATQVNANGTVATYSYDPLNRLTELVHTNGSGDVIASYAYELGPNGNRLSLTEATGRVVEYSYDNLYRLLTETVTDPINGNHVSAWSYDAVGNRLQQNIDGVITTYSYNDNDHLLTETENGIITTYAYDDNGNTITKSIDGVVDTTYGYSKDNRMLTAQTSTSNISYSYDAGGIRQSQTVDGVTTNYLVDPNRSYHQVLEEQDDLLIPQVIYTYGDDLISQTNAQGTHVFGYDGLGSTRILTDTAGTVQNSYGYQAFGELDYQHGTLENSYLFTGEQYDNNVGFYYLRARYYNPSIGRFQNMDTFPGMAFEPMSLHKYLYTHADPVNNLDPSGYFSISSFMSALKASAIQGAYATVRYGKILYRVAAQVVVNSQVMIARVVASVTNAASKAKKVFNMGKAIRKFAREFKKFRRSKKFKEKQGNHYVDLWGFSRVNAPNQNRPGKYRKIFKINYRYNKDKGGGRIFMVQYNIGKNNNGPGSGAFMFRLDYQDYTTTPSTFKPHYHLCWASGDDCKKHHYL